MLWVFKQKQLSLGFEPVSSPAGNIAGIEVVV